MWLSCHPERSRRVTTKCDFAPLMQVLLMYSKNITLKGSVTAQARW